MALPQVQIEIAQGRLGRIQPVGEQMALVHTATTVSSTFLLNTPYTIRSVKDADTLGLNTSSNTDLYQQIKDYYQVLGDGATLLVLGVSKTTTFSTLAATTSTLSTLLNNNPGITLLGISHQEHTSISPRAAVNGLRGNIQASVALLNGLAERYTNQSRPFHIILGGSNLSSFNDLISYKTGSYSNTSLLISSIRKSTQAAVGFTLAYLATLPVQRKLSRVRNGALPIAAAYFTNQTTTEDSYSTYADLHDKRYLFIRTYAGRTGYYFADDTNLTQVSSDYASLASRRVLNKIIRISQDVFLNEIGQEVAIEADGTLSPAAARYYETLIENAITLQMVSEGALSNIQAQVDERQQVLKNDELRVQLEAQPVGYTNTLRVNVGFALAVNDEA